MSRTSYKLMEKVLLVKKKTFKNILYQALSVG